MISELIKLVCRLLVKSSLVSEEIVVGDHLSFWILHLILVFGGIIIIEVGSVVAGTAMTVWASIATAIVTSVASSLVLIASAEALVATFSSIASAWGHLARCVDEFARIVKVVFSHHLIESGCVELAFKDLGVLVVEVLLDELRSLELLITVSTRIDLFCDHLDLLVNVLLLHLHQNVIITG